jgi:hypothetical protein
VLTTRENAVTSPDVAVSPGEPAIDAVFAVQTSVVTHCERQAGQVSIDLARSVT